MTGPERVRVRVPASAANLGPGFDCAGLALAWQDEVRVSVGGDGLSVRVTGEGEGEVPLDEEHLVVRALRLGLRHAGRPVPDLQVSCRNRIPHARGLGSSAAAIVAGLLAADALVGGRLGRSQVLRLGAGLEGHPDNVAACLLGGLTLAWSADGSVSAVRLEPVAGLSAVAFVPPDRSSTREARGLLPATVPYADAAANAGRAALLVHGVTSDPGVLLAATEDRLHQPYRAPAMPASAALLGRLRTAGVPAVLSGAGPTVLALVEPDAPAPGDTDGTGFAGFTVVPLAVDRDGATVLAGAG